MTTLRDEIRRLNEELAAARRHITELEAELQALRADLAEATGSASARMALSVAVSFGSFGLAIRAGNR